MKEIISEKKKILTYILSIILVLAGIAHFLIPDAFIVAMPPYIPFHLEVIYLTGLIEIIFAVSLNTKKYKVITCYLLSAYFIAILPAHIYVSMNSIEMFGVSNPFLLWMRTIFQIVFILWPLYILKQEQAS